MHSSSHSLTYRLFDRLARSVIARPWIWLGVWLLLAALALPGSLKLHSILQGANGGIKDSEALHAAQLLEKRFAFPYLNTYLVTFEHPQLTVDDPAYKSRLQQIRQRLLKENDTLAIQSIETAPEPRLMRSEDGHKSYLLIGQKSAPVEVLEKRAGELRAALAPEIAQIKAEQPDWRILLTGMNAVIYDINDVTSKSTEEAERRVLIFTLLLLLVAFGSITGALLPGLMAVFANLIGLGLIYQIAQLTPVSVYAQTISTMIGLAVGIDYALLVVWRYREELAKGLNRPEALRVTIIQAGTSVLYAGLTFAMGLAGLWFTGITALFSIGLGGTVVVLLSIALSLTLLPALLQILGEWLEFPRFLSRRLARLKPSQLWEPMALKIMNKPLVIAGLALLVVAGLSAPALQLHIGEFDLDNLPEQLESKQGLDQLREMSVSGILVPMFLMLEAPAGENMLQQKHLKNLQQVHLQLAAHPLIEKVYSLAGVGDDPASDALFRQLPFLQLAFPQMFETFLSSDQQIAMVQVVPKQLKDYEAQIDYVQELRDQLAPQLAAQGLKLSIGGSAALTLDYNIASFRYMPQIMLGVIVATWLFLLFALRSYLIALKAIVLNLFSVSVSYGVITMVFQYGLLPGVKQSSIMAYVPLLLFCIIFGMSIDYEVFLMARIKEEYDAGHSNEQATARGIRATGDVITYAALIMCIVFGAFTLVEISIIKQLGFGLATAIFVDATLIRMVLVPAFMKLAGKWNWYPGNRRQHS